MNDELFNRMKDAGLEGSEELEVVITGDYSSGPVLTTAPFNLTLRPGYRWWQRLWAFIRRRKLVTSYEIPNATIGSFQYHEDGTASVEIKAQDGLMPTEEEA